jgi:hypothetical protein
VLAIDRRFVAGSRVLGQVLGRRPEHPLAGVHRRLRGRHGAPLFIHSLPTFIQHRYPGAAAPLAKVKCCHPVGVSHARAASRRRPSARVVASIDVEGRGARPRPADEQLVGVGQGCLLPIADWDVSAITDMSSLFKDLTNFNANISGTGHLERHNHANMRYMFISCAPRVP